MPNIIISFFYDLCSLWNNSCINKVLIVVGKTTIEALVVQDN